MRSLATILASLGMLVIAAASATADDRDLGEAMPWLETPPPAGPTVAVPDWLSRRDQPMTANELALLGRLHRGDAAGAAVRLWRIAAPRLAAFAGDGADLDRLGAIFRNAFVTAAADGASAWEAIPAAFAAFAAAGGAAGPEERVRLFEEVVLALFPDRWQNSPLAGLGDG